jgi:hypothetical protein
MLCSKKISLPSKFNVKLQNFRGGGGVRDLGQGGGWYQHPVAMYALSMMCGIRTGRIFSLVLTHNTTKLAVLYLYSLLVKATLLGDLLK